MVHLHQMKSPLSVFIAVTFLFNSSSLTIVKANELQLPKPGTMVRLSPALNPPVLKGIKVHPDNPFKFDFILDRGDVDKKSIVETRFITSKLIKYFLASLTTPEKEMWVNLSPYEKDRIVPESFGQTEMGRDLLAQDYILKQITASLIYPEDEIGKEFWKRIYEEAGKKFNNTNIPVNTFNKVWIVPNKSVVYENTKNGTAYVVESTLKVMLEEDYLAVQKNGFNQTATTPAGSRNDSTQQIMKEVVIPQLTKEINEGANFAQLRQIYNSLILAAWYKKKVKDSILSQVYADKNKVAGVNTDDPLEKEKIYARYLEAFKKGAYGFIKEDQDPVSKKLIPRKYFSGGLKMVIDLVEKDKMSPAMAVTISKLSLSLIGVGLVAEHLNTSPDFKNRAMASGLEEIKNEAQQALTSNNKKTAHVGGDRRWGRISTLFGLFAVLGGVGWYFTLPESKQEVSSKKVDSFAPFSVFSFDGNVSSVEIVKPANVINDVKPEQSPAIDDSEKIVRESVSNFIKAAINFLAAQAWVDATSFDTLEKNIINKFTPDLQHSIKITSEWRGLEEKFKKFRLGNIDSKLKVGMGGDYIFLFRGLLEGFQILPQLLNDTLTLEDFNNLERLLMHAQMNASNFNSNIPDYIRDRFEALSRLFPNMDIKQKILFFNSWNNRMGFLESRISSVGGVRNFLRNETALKVYFNEKEISSVDYNQDIYLQVIKAMKADNGRNNEFKAILERMRSEFPSLSKSQDEKPLTMKLVAEYQTFLDQGFGSDGAFKKLHLKYDASEARKKTIDVSKVVPGSLGVVSVEDGAINKAMTANQQKELVEHRNSKMFKGGIDFNSDLMDLQAQNPSTGSWQGSGGDIKLNIDPAILKQLQDAPGFTPVIINIQPMKDVRLFLGLQQ